MVTASPDTPANLPPLDQLAAEVLTTEQRGRIVALRSAREVLVARGLTNAGPADPMDLVNLARYIESGRDPWDDDNAREAGELE